MPTILVAEDNPVTAEMIAVRLGNAGYEAVRANSGREALDLASAHRPDLILLDVMMPELDGFEVLRELKRDPLLGAVPVVMVSARSQEPDILAALAMGAEDYVTKPFSFRELLARVERVLSEGPGHLRATLRRASGTACVGEVLGGDARKVSLRFRQESAPAYAVGDRATLSMSSPALPEAIELAATVVGRAEAEPHRTFHLRLEELHRQQEDMAQAFLRLIGSRGTTRVRFGPGEHVPVRMTAKRSGGTLELEGALLDVSATGAGVALKGGADRLLFDVDVATLHFRLPGSDAALDVPVAIRHRRATAEGGSYGVRFRQEGAAEMLEFYAEITDFVVGRQDAGASDA